jgi:esterase/lipase superfamily enzyme
VLELAAELARACPSGRVTLVSHSCGSILLRPFLRDLARDQNSPDPTLPIRVKRSGRALLETVASEQATGNPDRTRAARKITFGLPRLASEVSDSKGFHSGRRG